MNDIVYSFYGKDIIMNVCILIKSFIKLLQDKFIKRFEVAAMRFYKSETYNTLQNTESVFWMELVEYKSEGSLWMIQILLKTRCWKNLF